MCTRYRPEYRPSAREIRDTFADEMRSLGGRMTDEFEDADSFIGRAVLQTDAEIRPNDVVKGGVAIRVNGPEVLVHPYTFRLVCTNGAIAAHALGTRRIERIECTEDFQSAYDIERTLADVGDAVRECANHDAFMEVAGDMRTAAEPEADYVLQLASMLARWPADIVRRFAPSIFQRFSADGDRTAFGLVNALTSVARDTRNAHDKWRLELLGGECLAAVRQLQTTRAAVHASRSAPELTRLAV